MRKMIKTCGMAVATTLIPFSLWGQSDLKIGYVDVQSIVAGSAESLVVEEQFQQEMIRWQSELQALQGELEELIGQYQAQEASMTLQSRTSREELILGKQEGFENRSQELEILASTRQQELYQPLMERIISIIEVVRREGSYTFIFNSSVGVFLYADESFDLTEEVTQRLASGGL